MRRKLLHKKTFGVGVTLAVIVLAALGGASTVLGSADTVSSPSVEEAPEAPPPLTGYASSTEPALSDEQITQIALTQAMKAGEYNPAMTAVNTTLKSAIESNPKNEGMASSPGMEALMSSE